MKADVFFETRPKFFVEILQKNYQKSELASNLIQLEASRLQGGVAITPDFWGFITPDNWGSITPGT